MTAGHDHRSPATPPIPSFATEEEAREYWATHDSALFFDQMEDVTNSPPPDLRTGPGRRPGNLPSAEGWARRRPEPGRE